MNTATATPDTASQIDIDDTGSDVGDGETGTEAGQSVTSSTTIARTNSASSKGKGKARAVDCEYDYTLEHAYQPHTRTDGADADDAAAREEIEVFRRKWIYY